MPHLRTVLPVLVLFGLSLSAHGADAGSCTDPATLHAARAEVEAQCDCASATNHSAYVRCVGRSAKRAASARTIPSDCVSPLKKCASKSSCGRAGYVTCCRTDSNGTTTCSVKLHASSCHKQGTLGSACVSAFPSCCDACTDSGCATTTSTSLVTSTSAESSSTTTTTP